ncbi:MAG: GNAT family N-acetyltransferase [Methanomassiliicoccales archaeon]|nr:GNAT family N-acetyltransferase [Methanomassiliicoccales archaeon]
MEQNDTFGDLEPFTTDRLLLRGLMIEDSEALHALKTDPDVTRLYGEVPYVSIEQTRTWVQECIDGLKGREVIVWAIVLRSTGTPIGMVCYWHIDHQDHHAELGYELAHDHWHKGMMSEALPPIISYGFDVLGLHRIEATPLAMNEASQRLLERNGFRKEGNLRDRIYFDGKFYDELYYALLKEQSTDLKTVN